MQIKDWFEEQIEQRKKKDLEDFQEAFADLATVVQGEQALSRMMLSDLKRTTKTIEQILHFYRIKPEKIQVQGEDLNEQLEEQLRPLGVMRRDVRLQEKWYQQTIGAILGFTAEGEAVAFLPKKHGYVYFDYTVGKWMKITNKNVHLFSDKAVCFYRPLPLKPVGTGELLQFCLETLDYRDYIYLALSFLAVSVAGLAMPYMTEQIFDKVLPQSDKVMLFAAAAALVGTTVSGTLFSVVRAMMISRCTVKMCISAEAAVMARLVSLPAEFFKKYNAGELTERVDSASEAIRDLMNVVVSLVFTLLCSVVYLFQIHVITPSLLVVTVWILVTVLVINLAAILYQVRLYKRRLFTKSKTAGMEYALYSGGQKLKLAGAERRAFSNWAKLYKENAAVTYNPPFLLKIIPALTAFCIYSGWGLIFVTAAGSGAEQGTFMAYNSACMLVMGAFLSCSEETGTISEIIAAFDMLKPVLYEMPEMSEQKEMVKNLSGAVEVSHVSFKYSENGPNVLQDISMRIRPGQYVGIVGKTGCGKSTLFRLMLGFEKPGKGTVYYDRKDIRKLDLMSLRQKIGTVLQDSFIFDGDILSNITIAAPWLGIDAAWEAARTANMEKEIEEMPMGMFTMVSESSGTISGGQKQRLMIARAIVSKPKILMFDEATSALDNVTQKKVTDALAEMKCTRIVIAHRLSTIKDCDKIFVMDEGRIAEEGTYDMLMKKEGIFADLVSRQQIH